MSDVFGSGLVKDGKNFVLKEDEEGISMDLLVSTETYDSKGRLIVEKMKTGLDSNKSVGGLFTPIAADFIEQNRLITVGVKGIQYFVTVEDIDANKLFMGAENSFVEDHTGVVELLHEILLDNIPVDTITSVIEDPSGAATVLTRVYVTSPAAGEYYIDMIKGLVIIGSATVLVYRITYSVNAGRIKECITEISETLTATANVITLSESVDSVISVDATGGSGGAKSIIYAGVPVAGQCTVDRTAGTITFAAADAITSADVIYKTGYKPLGKTLEKKEAGEPVACDFEGGKI